MSQKTKELLAVLDLPEGEQWIWVSENYKDKFWSLADLAFRLRDEAANMRYSKLVSAMEKVAMKSAKALTSYDMEGFNEWFAMVAKPIHWIIAALISKELAKGEKKQ